MLINLFLEYSLIITLIFLWLHLFRILFYTFNIPILISNTGLIINGKEFKPITISQIHAETLSGRISLTFLWTNLGVILTFSSLIETNNPLSFFHLIISLLSIFPLRPPISEICLFIEISSIIHTIIHSLLGFIYFIVFPIIILSIKFNIITLCVLIGFVVNILMFEIKFKYSSILEAILVTIVSLQSFYYNPLILRLN